MLEYILLGVLQGVFEWLPVSSEGVVALASKFLMVAGPIDMALFLHLGTLFSAIIYFRNDWKEVLTGKNRGLQSFLVVSTAVSLAIGFVLYQFISSWAIGAGLLFLTGIGLLATACFHKKKHKINLSSRTLSLLCGALQGIAVIPGVSRSGATIFGLSLSGMKPKRALTISYMMSVPAVVASSAYLIIKDPRLSSNGWIALIFAFLTGLITLQAIFKISERLNFFKLALIFSLLCFLGAFIEFYVKIL